MKLTCRLKAVYLYVFCLLIALCVLAGGTSYAETGAQYTATDGAEVRVEYEGILNAYETLAERYQMEGRKEVMAQAREALTSATDEELAGLAPMLAEIRQWRQAADVWVTSTESNGVQITEPADRLRSVTSGGLPDAEYVWGETSRVSEDDLFWGLFAYNTALGVYIAANRACEQFMFHVPCLISDGVYVVAVMVYETMVRNYDDFTSEEVYASYLRLGHIHTDLGAVGDSLSAKFGSLDFIAEGINSIQFGLDQHRIYFNAWTTFDLRSKIEENLAMHGQQANPLAIFVLPEQFGGHLELAREIVAETISNMMAAGQKVYFAEEQLAKGDEEFAAGNYKLAYKYFGAAYISATK